MRSNLSDDLRRDRRAAAREYSASMMSNAKWRAVLSALHADKLGIRQILVKFIDVDVASRMPLPHLYTPHSYVEGSFGPMPLVGIEWVEIPEVAIFHRSNNVPAERYAQDIHAIRSALDATGKKLTILDTPTGIRILGHVR